MPFLILAGFDNNPLPKISGLTLDRINIHINALTLKFKNWQLLIS